MLGEFLQDLGKKATPVVKDVVDMARVPGELLREMELGIEIKTYKRITYNIVPEIFKPGTPENFRYKFEIYLPGGAVSSHQRTRGEADRAARDNIDNYLRELEESTFLKDRLKATEREEFDFGVLIAIDAEWARFRKWDQIELQGPVKIGGGINAARRFRFKRADMPWTGIAVLTHAGPQAQTVSTTLMLQFKITKGLINLGISGALQDVDVGDVVFATDSFDYMRDAKVGEGENQDLDWRFGIAGGSLANEKVEDFRISDERDELTEKCLLARDTVCSKHEGLELPDPTVHFGITLSGPMVVKSEQWKDLLLERAGSRKALCVGEEDGSIVASYLRFPGEKPDMIVIRGISDYANASKDDQKDPKTKGESTKGKAIREYAIDNTLRALESLLAACYREPAQEKSK